MFGNIYNNKRVLITGHTGFKGSWLALWLQSLGAKVTGISLPFENECDHWNLLRLEIPSLSIDIRDEQALSSALHKINPEIIFHLAAQSLVRRSYREPLATWATNVMGTANLLNACRELENLAAVVIVTTDKCYENKEWIWGYREIDPLGGHDPYSSSKAGTELVVKSFRSAFFNTPSSPLIATARAGNVIGGGDWSEDRLIPDLVRSVGSGEKLKIRSPKATRPWQYVLESLSGYLMLGQQLLQKNNAFADAWNFGPDQSGNRSVEEVLNVIKKQWPAIDWFNAQGEKVTLHEAQLLHLDCSKAREKLFWRPVLTFAESVAATSVWYQSWLNQKVVISQQQLQQYVNLASERHLKWTKA